MKHLLFTMLIISIISISYGQQQISGTVRSASEDVPLEGASVKLPNGREVTTDRNGKFLLAAPAGSFSLIVSYVGYITDTLAINLPITAPLVISLDPSTEFMREVVVSTGYQSLPRERSTGSFSHIDNETFNQQVTTDVMSRLEAVAGAYVVDRRGERAARPLIRGLGTLNGPTEPLVILDNFPYDGDINNINPNDVEDISILKDAAAASIWGARAANGVIVIRTKQGNYNQSLKIGVQANTTIENKANLGYIPQMSSSDFIDVERFLYQHGFYTGRINQNTRPALSPVVELLIKREDANPAEMAAIDAQMDGWRGLDVRNDFKRYVYQPSVNQQYALSVEGGADRLAWTATAGFDHNKDNLDGGYQRLNLRLQNRYKPVDWLEISTGLRYTLSQTKRGREGFGNVTVINSLYPYAQFADEYGNPLPLTKNLRQAFIDETNGAGQLLDWSYYPLDDYKHTDNTTALSDLLATTQLNFRITHWLGAEVEYQYERQDNNGRVLHGIGSFFTRDLINRYSQIDGSGDVQRHIPVGEILDLSNNQLNSHQARGKLNVNHGWGNHQITAIGGSEIRHAGTQSNRHRTYGYNDDILTFGAVDYLNPYPLYHSGSPTFIPRADGFGRQTTRFISMFANGAYEYDSRYTLSISGRRDASNLFGLATNDQWNLFWSLGGAWNVSNESFYNVSWLQNLRLRATYGKSGNIDPSMVATTTMAYVTMDPYTLTPWARFANYYNPDLTWETSAMTNIGIDFGLFGRRINGSIEYYHKSGTDLFGRAVVDYTGGVGRTITKNASSMVGNGIDLELNSVNIDAAVKWQSNIRFSHYQDKVTSNIPATTTVSSIVAADGGTTGVLAVEGKPVNALFSYRWAGLDSETGDPLGYLNGELSNDYNALRGNTQTINDIVYHGSTIPTWFGSLGNSVSYKQFSLAFSLVYKFGHYYRRPSVRYWDLFNNWNFAHSDFSRRWQQPGDELTTNVPSMGYPANSSRDLFYTGSEVLVERGDHIRLQFLQVSYSLPFFRKTRISSAQIFFNANNVGVLWQANKSGLDPDFVGLNTLVVPTSYSFGIRFSMN